MATDIDPRPDPRGEQERPRRPDGRRVVVALALFFGLLLIYNANRSVLLGNDTRPVRYAAVSLLKRGDLDLNEFSRFILQGRSDWPYYVIQTSSGAVISRFGFGTVLAAAPVFGVGLALGGGRITEVRAIYLAKLTSSIYVAGTAVILFFAALLLLARGGRPEDPDERPVQEASSRKRLALAALVASLYGLGTCAYSVVSQALWQHGPAELFLALAVLLLIRRGDAALAGAGAALAAMVVCRPPMMVFALMGALYVVLSSWQQRRRQIGLFLLGVAPLALAQLAYNQHYLGAPWIFSQMLHVQGSDALPHESYWGQSMVEGLSGMLLSPSRGLFVYSPFFLLLLAHPRRIWTQSPRALRWMLGGALLLLLVQASYYGWYGGWTFGYRMLVDATPVLCLAMLPVLRSLTLRGWVVLGALAAVSLVIHAAGACCYDPFGWDMNPDIDQHPERLWSIIDSQLVYLFSNLEPRPPL